MGKKQGSHLTVHGGHVVASMSVVMVLVNSACKKTYQQQRLDV